MKKILCIIILLVLLSGCVSTQPSDSNQNAKQDYITGVWISYSELDGMLAGDFKANFNAAVNNCITRGITDVFIHVRPFCDSYYPSQYFATRDSAKHYDYDVLQYMINVCHQNRIRLHAWLNPYRVKTADSEISSLPDGNPAKKWLTDEDADNDVNVCCEDGVYLNPASSEVRALIIDGIREIIDNYNVDGIHFDDYFYPTQSEMFDSASYKQYCDATQKPLPLDDFRRANINALISGVYTAVKFKSKDIVFSVSPAASITENYTKHYADVAAWIESGCVDYIIPQLYFGFEYPDSDYKFDKLLDDWRQEFSGTDAKLIIGLATYKIDTQNEPDRAEWIKGADVIRKQAEICKRAEGISGHIYFSYSSMSEQL